MADCRMEPLRALLAAAADEADASDDNDDDDDTDELECETVCSRLPPPPPPDALCMRKLLRPLVETGRCGTMNSMVTVVAAAVGWVSSVLWLRWAGWTQILSVADCVDLAGVDDVNLVISSGRVSSESNIERKKRNKKHDE